MTHLLLFGPLLLLSLTLAYLLVLAAASLLPVRRAPRREPRLRFAVVVPAHDEETTLPRTLASLAGLDYPAELFQVAVVADNCTDRTADVARAAGARCLERRDPENRGKGQALAFAFEALLAEPFDAFVILDADTVVDPGFLRVLNDRQLDGQRVVQSWDGVANPAAGPLTYLFHVGNVIENRLFHGGKERLGLPSILRGTGMCLAADVLREHPWRAFSVVEDTEYGLALLRAGQTVRFAPEIKALAEAPTTPAQARAQRIRWASGNSGLSKRLALRLLAEGLKGRGLGLADAGWSLLVRSKSLLLLAFAGTVAAAHLLGAFTVWADALAGVFVAYLLSGIALDGLGKARWPHLLRLPGFVCWLLAISLLGLAGHRETVWARTSRS